MVDPDAVVPAAAGTTASVVDNAEAFKEAVTRAASLVQGGGLATFGIVPDLPETGYGYIRRGEVASLNTTDADAVAFGRGAVC